jgi:4-amino-4-deoxy-L-arabinose transferase-like glycosyltransferase
VDRSQHALRVGLLVASAGILLGWVVWHSEASFADGLRYIHRAERIQADHFRGSLVSGVDHPLHPLGIALVHNLIGGADPASWQLAALLLCFASAVLLVVPVYLLTLELYGDQAAWMAGVLVAVNPIIGYVVVNVLSESTFLFWWTFGLWGSVRFLREGRFAWLPLALGFGALAYLTRPEGMLLPAALLATLGLLPILRATRINWPRWWQAMAFLVAGLVFLVGPYVAFKGGLATKPGIGRVLGLAPGSQPLALERERPLAEGQTALDTYRIATVRMAKVFRAAVTPPLFPFALLGLALAATHKSRIRAWLFLTIVLCASAFALVRLHATGGYCTVRHGLVPGMLLTLAAAHGITWLMSKVWIPGRWLGLANERLRPGPAVWFALVLLLVVVPNLRPLGPLKAGPFSVYREAGRWLAQNTSNEGGLVLDLTDWSLYFSSRPGYLFANVYEAPRNSATRWIVARKPHIEGHWHYSKVLRDLIGDRQPVALVPRNSDPKHVQIRIYDLRAPADQTAATAVPQGQETRVR